MLLSVTYGILPAELRCRLSSSDYALLAGYYRLNPWGPWRDDLRVGHLTSLMYNINRGKGAPSMSPQDFTFDPQRAERMQDEKDKATLAMFDRMAHKSGGGNG